MSLPLRIFALTLLLATLCEGAAPVRLICRSGRIGSVGQTFRFGISIEKDARNRSWCLEWISAQAQGRTCDTLNGEAAAITRWRDITFRRGGEYFVMAWVRQANDSILQSNVETITIQDPFGE